MYSSMPELYDTVYYSDRKKLGEYYHVNQVNKLGEYAILALAKHYKYRVLPHYLVRGGKEPFQVLNILRNLRTSFFFQHQDFLELVNLYIETVDVIATFIDSN